MPRRDANTDRDPPGISLELGSCLTEFSGGARLTLPPTRGEGIRKDVQIRLRLTPSPLVGEGGVGGERVAPPGSADTPIGSLFLSWSGFRTHASNQ